MKLLIEVLAGMAAYGVGYYLARPYFTEDEVVPAARHGPDVHRSNVNGERAPVPAVRSPDRAAVDRAPMTAPMTAGEGSAAAPSPAQQSSMNVLRNAVIRATAEDMHRRGEDLVKCLDGIQLGGAEKVRFAVEVVARPGEATTGRWRFVEIADGEPLPASFASCAARALGGGQHLVPPKDLHFPAYHGDLSILYTIPGIPGPSTD